MCFKNKSITDIDKSREKNSNDEFADRVLCNVNENSLIQKMPFYDTELISENDLVHTAMKISKTLENVCLYESITSDESSNESMNSNDSEAIIIKNVKTRMSFLTSSIERTKFKNKKIKVIVNLYIYVY